MTSTTPSRWRHCSSSPAGAASVRRTVTAMSLDRMVNALHDGHAFLCASERQRDLWTGSLLAQRLISPAVHDADPSLGGLLAVVPFGVPDAPPAPGAGPRERFGLAADAELVLWNGGLWDWLDAESVLRRGRAAQPGAPPAATRVHGCLGRRPGARRRGPGPATSPASSACSAAS